jgi:hypothetical protein
LFIVLRLDDLLLGHLAVSWNLGLLHHLSQGFVLITQLIDLGGELVTGGLDKGLGVPLDALHLLPDGFVLPLEVFEGAQGAVHVVLVPVLVNREGYVRLLLAQI